MPKINKDFMKKLESDSKKQTNEFVFEKSEKEMKLFFKMLNDESERVGNFFDQRMIDY